MGSVQKMASSDQAIIFSIETDSFLSSPLVEKSLDKKWLDLAEVLLGENRNNRQQKLSDFKTVLYADPKLSKFMTPTLLQSNTYLNIYLRAGAWDVTAALAVLNNFYSLGLNYKPYVEMSFPSKLGHVWREQLNTVCEKRDKFGRRVLLMRLGKWDPDTIPVEHFFASVFVLLEMITREVKTQIAGLTVVIDVQGLSFKHIRNLGINEIRLASAFLQGSFPLWVRKIHIVNQPRLWSVLMNLAKPFLSENAKEGLVMHGQDLTSFHKEVPPELLWTDLGGPGAFDNTAAVAAVTGMEQHFQELVGLTLTL